RWGAKMGDGRMRDLMVYDGLTCPFHDVHMAVHASHVANKLGITREEQDEWALRSHVRAIKAMEEGTFANEMISVEARDKKGKINTVHTDEGPRRDTNLEKLSSLRAVFDKDGTITAGNAPGVNDGAGAFLLMSEKKA